MLSIVVCCDHNYVVPLAALVSSLSDTQRAPFELHVLQDGIANDDRVRIQSTASALIRWCDVDSATFEGIPTPSHLPASALFRLLIADQLPHLARAIYLDTDTIVVDDLEPLWQQDLGRAVIGAAHDPYVDVLGGSPGLPFVRRGLTSSMPYFNSGVMLIDLERWRQSDVSAAALSLLRESTLAYADQCALNLVLANQWARIDPRYNLQPAHLDTLGWVSDSEECSELARALQHPAVHHFVGRKPWGPGGGDVARSGLWFDTLDQTAFAQWRSAETPTEVSVSPARVKLKRLSSALRRRLVEAAQPVAERAGVRVELATNSPGMQARRERDRVWDELSGTVVDGPFAGFRLPAAARRRSGAIPIVTGTYEPELTQVLLDATTLEDRAVIASSDVGWFLAPALASARRTSVSVVGAESDRALITAMAALNDVSARVTFGRHATPAIRRCAVRQVWLLNHEDLADTMSDPVATTRRDSAVLIVPIHDTRRGYGGTLTSDLLRLLEPTHRIEFIAKTDRDPTRSAVVRAVPEPACWLLASEWDGRRRSGWLHLEPKHV
jgi:lipopolysaccharide biosynthesis glycosyltransferase